MCGTVAMDLSAFGASMQDHESFFRIRLRADGFHHSAACVCAIARMDVHMQGPKTERTVVSGSESQRMDLFSAVCAKKSAIIFCKPFLFHGSSPSVASFYSISLAYGTEKVKLFDRKIGTENRDRQSREIISERRIDRVICFQPRSRNEMTGTGLKDSVQLANRTDLCMFFRSRRIFILTFGKRYCIIKKSVRKYFGYRRKLWIRQISSGFAMQQKKYAAE